MGVCAYRGSLLQCWGVVAFRKLPSALLKALGLPRGSLSFAGMLGGESSSDPPKWASPRSDPAVPGGRLGAEPEAFRPSRDTCFQKQKPPETGGSQLRKCALGAENKVSCRAGAPCLPDCLAMAFCSPTNRRKKKNNNNKRKGGEKSPPFRAGSPIAGTVWERSNTDPSMARSGSQAWGWLSRSFPLLAFRFDL